MCSSASVHFWILPDLFLRTNECMYDLYRIIIYIQQINRLGFESRLVQLMFTKQKKCPLSDFLLLVQSIWFEYLFLKLVCFLSWISLNIAVMLRCSQTNCQWFSCGDKASFINLALFFFAFTWLFRWPWSCHYNTSTFCCFPEEGIQPYVVMLS